MSAALIDVHFVRLRTFDRAAKGLLSDEDEREIEKDIAQDPEAAPVITATGGDGEFHGEAMNIMKKSRKVRNERRASTQSAMGSAIIEALGEAIAFRDGKKTGATVQTVTARRAKAAPAPKYRGPQIARLRKLMKLSQPVFADALNVSSASVKSWEQGINEPSGAALRLLQIAERHPEVILERITTR